MRPRAWLWPFSVPYGVAIGARNRLYDLGLFAAQGAGAPVISVGNISVGGTGKTPFVLHLIERLRVLHPGRGLKIAVVSRGYRRRGKGTEIVSDGRRVTGNLLTAGDEPFMLAESTHGVVVIVDNNRVRGARLAGDQFKASVIVADDGFQHRRLKRDLDIVLLDGRNPLGNRLLLPAGVLREPVASLKRAGLVLLSKSVGSDDELRERSARLSLLIGKPVAATRLKPDYWRRIGRGEILAADEANGKRVAAFAGIAYPGSFFETVERLGAEIVARIPLPDHCRYDKFYLDKIALQFTRSRAEWLVTTAKDGVKLPPILRLLPVYQLNVSHEIVVGGEMLDQALMRVLECVRRS